MREHEPSALDNFAFTISNLTILRFTVTNIPEINGLISIIIALLPVLVITVNAEYRTAFTRKVGRKLPPGH